MSATEPAQYDGLEDIQTLIESHTAEREEVASEIEVLKSIYGENAVQPWNPASDSVDALSTAQGPRRDATVRYTITLSLLVPYDEVAIKVLVSLPPTYPSTSPPQLQLLSRYLGAFGADSELFGAILRTFISVNGVEWTADTVCVFDGLQNVVERCTRWYEDRLSAEKAGELVREEAHHSSQSQALAGSRADLENSLSQSVAGGGYAIPSNARVDLPSGVEIFEAEPITDRKSAFVGRACAIQDPSQVPLVLSYLQADRKIARAAHPVINAWRCKVGNVLHQDNDDDGETAAGGRLAHLLQILEVNNVLVVVTRYFGGIHLGPDRFKHINQAARNALEFGGFLDHDAGEGGASQKRTQAQARGRKR